MTTPLNFIFAPLGTELTFVALALAGWALESCPQTRDVPAMTNARANATISGRDVLLTSLLILQLLRH
jgi:hypothetical protein